MIEQLQRRRFSPGFRSLVSFLIITFVFDTVLPAAHAQSALTLPAPNVLVHLTPDYSPLLLKGIQIFPDNPLRFDFLVDKGDSGLNGQPLKEETIRSIKYFLTSLTVPEKDMWVNLSPYEKNRIAALGFGQTVMGKDLLEQDYLLKQITSTLIYPEEDLGKEFWKKLYAKVHEKFGTTNVGIDMLNRVWIVPQTAEVFVHRNGAFVVSSKMDVMLESDYLVMQKHKMGMPQEAEQIIKENSQDGVQSAYTQVLREVIIPEIRKEVNEGKTFASLRQAYNAMILATWYKRNLKRSLLAKIYVRQNKVDGVQNDDLAIKEKIFEQYVQSFVKGVYNYIREDYDPRSQEIITREYVSGGIEWKDLDAVYRETTSSAVLGNVTVSSSTLMASVGIGLKTGNTQLSFPDSRLPHTLKTIFQPGGPVQVAASPLSRDDQRDLWKRLRGWMNVLSIALAFGLTSAALAPAANAANFSIDNKGNVMITVQEKDSKEGFGGIVKQVKKQFRKADPQRYAESVLSGHYWGPNGVVAILADGQEVGVIKAGQTFKIPAGTLSEKAVKALTGKDTTAYKTGSLKMSYELKEPAPQRSVSLLEKVVMLGVEKPAEIAPGSLVLKQTNTLAKTTEVSGENKYEIYTALPTEDEKKPYLSYSSGGKTASPPVVSEVKESIVAHPPLEPGDTFLLSAFLLLWAAGRRFTDRGSVRGAPQEAAGGGSGEPEGEGVLATLDEAAISAEIPGPASLTEAVLEEAAPDFGVLEDTIAEAPSETEVKFTEEMTGLMATGMAPEQAYQQAAERLRPVEDFTVPDQSPTAPSDDELRRTQEILAKVKASGGHTIGGGDVSRTMGAAAFVPAGDKRSSFWPRWFMVILGVVGIAGFYLYSVGALATIMSAVGLSLACGNFIVIWIAKEGEPLEFYPQWVRTGIANTLELLTLRGGESAGIVMFAWDPKKKVTVPIMVKVLKNKRGGDLAKAIDRAFAKAVKRAVKQGLEPMPGSRTFSLGGHVRLPTGGMSLLEAAHLFTTAAGLFGLWRFGRGDFHIQGQWSLQGGAFAPRQDNVIVTIGANGDNLQAQAFDQTLNTKELRDYYGEIYQHELGEPVRWSNERDDQGNLPDPHRIVPGDSPPIALQVLFRLTQGNWKSSLRYAYVNAIHKSTQEVVDNIMTPEHEAAVTAEIESVFLRHALVLSRPGLQKENKSFADCWTTAEDVKKDGRWAMQLKALDDFREDLLNTLTGLRDAQLDKDESKHSEVGKGIRHWKRYDDETLKGFVDLMVERFFIGDRSMAVKEFAEQAAGTFGVQVRTSTDPNGITLYSNEQGLAIGYNVKERFLAVSSEHSSLMVDYGDRGTLDNIIFMNSEAPGQMADIRVNETGRLFDMNVYSFKLGRKLTAAEIRADSFPQKAENPYYRKPLQYADPSNKPGEDIASLPARTAELSSQWQELADPSQPKPHNLQSGEVMFEKFLSRDIEGYIKENSQAYGALQGRFVDELTHVIDETIDTSTEQGRQSKARILHHVQNDKRILPYLRDYIDRLIGQMSDTFAHGMIIGQKTEADLPEARQQFEDIVRLRLNTELKRIIGRITTHDFRALNKWLEEARAQSGEEETIGAGEIDFLQVGYESSENLGHAVNELYAIVFPRMKTLAMSSNKGLSLDGKHGIGRRTVARINTKSGATAPSQKGVSRLKRIMPGNVFVTQSRIDTLVAFALGQKFLPDSPFSQHIFYTGDYFPSEAVSAGEILLFINDLELIIYMAKRFRAMFPHRQPFGMTMTAEEIGELEHLRDGMVAKMEELTGTDVKGEKKETPVHETIAKTGRKYIGKTLLEGPSNNFVFRMFVLAVFLFGAPIQAIFSYFTGVPTPPYTEIWGLIPRLLDFALAVTFQFWCTTLVYRYFSERPKWARLSGLTLAINDPSLFIREAQEMFTVKEGSMSPGSMHMHVLSTDPTDTTAGKLSPRVSRGMLALFGVPYDPEKRNQVVLTIQQIRAIGNGIFGHFMKGGAEIFTISHEDLPSSLSHHNMNIGKPDIRTTTPKVMQFYQHGFDVLERLVAGKVLIDEAYRYATTSKIKFINKVVQIWDRSKTFFRTGVLSTAIPVMESKTVKVMEEQQDPLADFVTVDSKVVEADTAAQPAKPVVSQASSATKREDVMPPGGIDLDAQWLEMKESENGEPAFFMNDQNIETVPIDGVFPNSIQFIPVNINGGLQQLLLGLSEPVYSPG